MDDEVKPTLYDLCGRYVRAVDWDDNHDDAYGEADVEYAEDRLREFINTTNKESK